MGAKFVRQAFGIIDELVAATALEYLEPYDWNEVEAFARALSGHAGLSKDAVADLVRGLPFPKGFRHLRCTNLNTGMSGGGYYPIDGSLPRAVTVAVLAIVEPELEKLRGVEKGVWVETIALPVRDKGVLELGFRYQKRN